MLCQDRTVWTGKGVVRENISVAAGTFRLAVEVAAALSAIGAGQFVMLRLPGRRDPLLGRPLAVYRLTRSAEKTLLEVVYLVVGRMTARLAEIRPGEELELWTPLGQVFTAYDDVHTVMVAGGIGQTPFLMHAAGLTRRTLLYGARSADRLCCVEDFERLGVEVHLATDDGSRGYHGPVTDLIETVLRPDEPARLICCGPHPMLRAAFREARRRNLPCEVSLETPMSCGLGICFGCVVKVRDADGSWDFRRTCVDGPVFDAYRLDWGE